MEKNRKYVKPSIKVIKVNKENIIVTSGSGPQSVTEGLFGAGKGGANVG